MPTSEYTPARAGLDRAVTMRGVAAQAVAAVGVLTRLWVALSLPLTVAGFTRIVR